MTNNQGNEPRVMFGNGVLRFVVEAIKCRRAYIDIDGCVLHPMSVPWHVPRYERLTYWIDNLCVTPISRRRLLLLCFLRASGVTLYIWTNRSPHHRLVTYAALGRYRVLFHPVCTYFMAGRKRDIPRDGPCMDDDETYTTHKGDLLVRPLKPVKIGRIIK